MLSWASIAPSNLLPALSPSRDWLSIEKRCGDFGNFWRFFQRARGKAPAGLPCATLRRRCGNQQCRPIEKPRTEKEFQGYIESNRNEKAVWNCLRSNLQVPGTGLEPYIQWILQPEYSVVCQFRHPAFGQAVTCMSWRREDSNHLRDEIVPPITVFETARFNHLSHLSVSVVTELRRKIQNCQPLWQRALKIYAPHLIHFPKSQLIAIRLSWNSTDLSSGLFESVALWERIYSRRASAGGNHPSGGRLRAVCVLRQGESTHAAKSTFPVTCCRRLCVRFAYNFILRWAPAKHAIVCCRLC